LRNKNILGLFGFKNQLLNRFLSRKQIGQRGEDITADFLRKKGMRILHRNLRLGRIEFDIIAKDEDSIVFVEVKTSRTHSYGDPVEWVTIQKQRRMAHAAKLYLQKFRILETPVRFDVVTVVALGTKNQIEHFRDAF